MSTVIRVENLSKKYIIGHQKQEQYTALRDVISNRVQSVFRKKTPQEAATEEFYALQDVSFDIEQGDRVGVIGRNGAGKSTLLKILSRITEPSSGRISIRGRVASLLEVGTGFHPELTGRENIFLNGAILGMSRVEIKRKFDEIVDFSEVERFLDTPVKRYSSGMYVRLAFAVAAHLEPEILIVDEVLAVGDAQFQRKCLGKMEDVSKNQGRTVLFVSHNIGAIKTLCQKGIFLEKGKLSEINEIERVLNVYTKSNSSFSGIKTAKFFGKLGTQLFFEELFVNGLDTNSTNVVLSPKDAIEIKTIAFATQSMNVKLTLSIYRDGSRLFSLHDTKQFDQVPAGDFESIFRIPAFLLRPGTYSIALGASKDSESGEWTWATDTIFFEILEEWSTSNSAFSTGVINIAQNNTRHLSGKLAHIQRS